MFDLMILYIHRMTGLIINALKSNQRQKNAVSAKGRMIHTIDFFRRHIRSHSFVKSYIF